MNFSKFFDEEIGSENRREWSTKDYQAIQDFIKEQNKNRSKKEILMEKLYSIQIEMEDYIEEDDFREELNFGFFVKKYCKVLGITQKTLAKFIGIAQPNLTKYVKGERKPNLDLIIKIARSFGSVPKLWLRVEIKSELNTLAKKEKERNEYKNFNLEELLYA